MINIGFAGFGYWGKNLLRAFKSLPECCVPVICDTSGNSLTRAAKLYPDMETTEDYERLLEDKLLDAVVFATPSSTHYIMSKAALLAGKHVFVEKPITLDISEAKELVNIAAEKNRILMVGHLLLYHPCVRYLRQIIENKELGKIYYIYTKRVNLGKVRTDENALWSFGPHDISIALYLLDDIPVNVSARGESYLQKDIEDIVFLSLQFENKMMFHIHLSWLDPHKVRRTTVVGSKSMAVFDDMEAREKIRIYDRGINVPGEYDSYGDYLSLREGEIRSPYVKMEEPLSLEAQHFIDCIKNNTKPLTDGCNGLAVLRVIDAAQRSLKMSGTPVEL